MGERASADQVPDLTQGVSLADVAEGALFAGRVGEEKVILARVGGEVLAVSATCTHYGGPLAEGLLVGDTVRCPWHHACFSLRTGEAVRAPAFDPVACWKVERQGDRVVVRERLSSRAKARTGSPPGAPERVIIIGGGAAGFAAAERLRREGYTGALTMVSNDADAPYDRPNLSKDYLAGDVKEDQPPLRPASFYAEAGIELRLGTPATRLAARASRLVLGDGSGLGFDRLLIATGAEPVRPPIPGADAAEVLVLRSFRDCQAIIARIGAARRAVVIGASFIGLEVAASLRQRGLEVRVVAPERQPLEAVLGPMLGARVRGTHEDKGVVFHLEAQVAAISPGQVRIKDGETLAADLVVLGTGVKPRVALAEAAGLPVDNGVLVDGYLETPVPGIFAAGDVARWPDPHSGERIRVEHWVVAERMGQTAALNMLGRRQPFASIPFFLSRHYHDLNIDYLGHAKGSDEIDVDGDVAAGRALLRYRRDGRVLAVATVDRDLDNLRAEVAMEQAAVGR